MAVFPGSGPYYVSEYRPGERVVLRRNPFYGGRREHHVEGFLVDLRASSEEEVLNRIERGEADWGWALPIVYFDPARRLAAKYGINKLRFFVHPGATWRGYAFNTSRPLFRNNPQLRRAVSFAIDRAAFRRAGGGRLSSTLTDQYLPASIPGFKDARIYPLSTPDLKRARVLARGHTRGGHAVLYTIDMPNHLAFAESIKANLSKIGLDVQIKPISLKAYFGKYLVHGDYDLGFVAWAPDYPDPAAVLSPLLDGRFVGVTNAARFDSPTYNRLLRAAAALQGAARYRAYGQLDARIAREAAPMIGIDVLNEAVLVSQRLGCVRRPFDLAAVCFR